MGIITRSRIQIRSKTSNYTALVTDELILVDSSGGAVTITLPAAANCRGKVIQIIKTDTSSNSVIADGNGAETINGASTVTMKTQYFVLSLISNGSGWNTIIRSNTAEKSEVWMYDGNGWGSTNTRIRRFTTAGSNVGTAITLTQSSTDGDIFTINEDGLYVITYSDSGSTAGDAIGISLNSNQLTTDINAITAAHRLAFVHIPVNNYSAQCCATRWLASGDIIRAHTSNITAGSNEDKATFMITKVKY